MNKRSIDRRRWSCSARRDGIIPSRRTETHGTCTSTSGHVSLARWTNGSCDIAERTNPTRDSKERRGRSWTARATTTENYSNGIHKTSQLLSPRLRSKLGEQPRSHTLYIRPFYVARRLVPALYLPDNLTPIYSFVRVKSWTSSTYHGRIIEFLKCFTKHQFCVR